MDDDAPLLARARTGDAEALAELIRRHEPALEATIRRLLSGRVRRRLAVSDVLQETRLTAHERFAQFEERGPAGLRRWLCAIAERKARRAVQRHVRVHKRSLDREVTRARRLATGQLVGRARSASEIAMAGEAAALARRALAALPPASQLVLRLCHEEGLTFTQAAERMKRSPDAVRKLYGRALARFAANLSRLEGPVRDR